MDMKIGPRENQSPQGIKWLLAPLPCYTFFFTFFNFRLSSKKQVSGHATLTSRAWLGRWITDLLVSLTYNFPKPGWLALGPIWLALRHGWPRWLALVPG